MHIYKIMQYAKGTYAKRSIP